MAAYRLAESSLLHRLGSGSVAQPTSTMDESYSEDLDEESIKLAIELQLEELENNYEPAINEVEVRAVRELYRSYLAETERFLADRKLAEELAAGVENWDDHDGETVSDWGIVGVTEVDDGETEVDDDGVTEVDDDGETVSDWRGVGVTEVDVRLEVEEAREAVEGNLDVADAEFEEQMKLACELSLKTFEEEKYNNEVCERWSIAFILSVR